MFCKWLLFINFLGMTKISDSTYMRSIENYQKILDDELFDKFPELKPFLEFSFYGKSYDVNLTGGEGRLKSANSLYQNTGYYYNSKKDSKMEFIHFTTLQSLFAITHSQNIRLASLNMVNDPNEIHFAASIFDLNPEYINHQKKSVLSFSFCEYQSEDKEIVTNANNLDLWRFYGQDGRGVAIKFKVTNDLNNWDSYHLSPIHYGKKSLNYWKKVNTGLQKFKKKHPEFYIHLIKLFCFHKHKFYKNEQEVRLIFSAHFNESKNELVYSKQGMYNDLFPKIGQVGNLFYNDLPLDRKNISDNQKSYFKVAPQISIDKIYLGYRFKENELNMYRDIINSLAVKASGNELTDNQIVITDLNSYYR